jgi:O-antigen/teichoic acid export membrane protein
VRYSSGDSSILKSSQIILIAISSLLVLLIYVFFRELILDNISLIVDYKISYELDFIITSFILSISGSSYLYYLTALKQYNFYNILLLAQSFTNLITILVSLQLLDSLIYAPILGQFFSWSLIFVVILFNFKFSKILYKKNEFFKLLKAGTRFYVNSFLTTIQQQIGRFYCIFFLPATDLAYFGQIQALVSLLIKVPAAMNTIILPEFSNGNQSNRVKSTIVYFVFAQIFVTLILALISEDLIYFLFGEKFIPIIEHFIFLLPFIALYCISAVLIGFQNSKNDFYSMNKILVVSFIIQVIYLAFSNLSFYNLILSIAVFNVAYFILTTIYSRKFLR